MGTSTDGQISFGFVFEEDYYFPWDAEKYDGEIEDWWKDVNRFEDLPGVYAEDGSAVAEYSVEKMEEYFKNRREWEKLNPLPVSLVNCCSDQCPKMIICVPGTTLNANRGYPQSFNPSELTYDQDALIILIKFMRQFKLEPEDPEVKWHLSSYWG